MAKEYDDITGGIITVTVVVRGGSVVVNGYEVSSGTTFTGISQLKISNFTGSGNATCTWGTKTSASIISGGKHDSYSGIVYHGSSSPLILDLRGSTTVAIVGDNYGQIPIYYGIDATTSSYKLGDGSWSITVSGGLTGGYGVTFESIGAKTLHVYDVIPVYSSNTKAIMEYNEHYSYVPVTDDVPIKTFGGYSEGQTVTAWSGWRGRWIRVKCSGGGGSSYNDNNATPSLNLDTTFVPRLNGGRALVPSRYDKYYIRKSFGGYNPAINGNTSAWTGALGPKPAPETLDSVLPNCVGYAVGRFNEIGGYGYCKYLGGPNAEDFVYYYANGGSGSLPLSKEPSLGACMVWRVGNIRNSKDGPGHVAIVEAINSDGSIITTESGWGSGWKAGDFGSFVWARKRYRGSDGNWGQGSAYKFLGFIVNPAQKFNALSNAYLSTDEEDSLPLGVKPDTYSPNLTSNAGLTSNANNPAGTGVIYQYEKEVIGSVGDIHGMQLLTTPTLVESPFIEVKIGDYTFGSYTKSGTVERRNSTARVTYPNYMESLRITKINGAVNQYVLVMNYKIQAGDDPNLIDKVFSSVSDSRKITLSYGDWNAPSFIYRDEEALITKVNSNVDFEQSQIRYTVYCTSTALSLKAKTYRFPAYTNTKPSTVVRELLTNNSYGLTEMFYGMKDINQVNSLGLIPSDDKAINIKPQADIDILTYLNYLVACMTSNSSQNDIIKDSAYYLVMKDEVTGDLDGPYFKIVKVNTKSTSLTSIKAYEVNVGFPDSTMVLNFQINNDDSWAILYNYAQSVDQEQYTYKIDNYGNMYSERSPNVTTSIRYHETTEDTKTWWTKMTQFPITATLTIKGLIRPAMLMEYVKINALFYGQRHVSSGLYVITRQEDEVSRAGYKTTLTLIRIAGDEDVLYNIKQTKVTQKAETTSNYSQESANKLAEKEDNILEMSKKRKSTQTVVSQQNNNSVPTTKPPQTG